MNWALRVAWNERWMGYLSWIFYFILVFFNNEVAGGGEEHEIGVGGKYTKGESVLIWYRKWKMKWTESACTQTVETVDDESVCWKSRLFNK